MMEFMRELQWQCYNKHQVSVKYLNNLGTLVYEYGVEMQPKPDETPLVYFTADRIPDAYDGGQATVYEHLYKSVEFTKANLGPNGFPLMLRSDWNDQLFKVCRKGKGESIWEAMHFGTMLKKLVELARLVGKKEDEAYFNKIYEEQKKLVNSLGWDGKW